MNYETLLELVEKRMSTRKIAKHLNLGQTTVRYWLKKFNLETKKLQPKNKCSKCDVLLSPENTYSHRKGNKISYCKDCHNQYTVERLQKQKEKAVEYKGGACQICGYCLCVDALDFHHIDHTQKGFTISKHKGRDFKNLIPELDKCLLVCCRCHREIHSGVTELPRLLIVKNGP